MKKICTLFVIISVVFTGHAEELPDLDSVVAGNSKFALDLYGQLRQQDGNLFFSPYSLSTALAMTYGGARGKTEQQMDDVLHFGQPQDQLHPVFQALQSRLKAVQHKGKVTMAVANSLWPQQGYEFLPSFLDLCRQQYGAAITPQDYAGATENARRAINDWTAEKTAQKITNLIPPGLLTAQTRLVLANAIYFKGDWQTQFNKRATRDEPFYVAPDKPVTARLMNHKLKTGYAETETVQLLRLSYIGRDLSMVVILPKTKNGLAEVERTMTDRDLRDWIEKTEQEREVQVTLPRFTFTRSFRVDQALQTLGMTDAFDAGKADFTAMEPKRELFISAVVHKAFVEVNEEGTEAAAATGVAIIQTSEMPEMKPKVFRADHPFLFLIRDNQTGSILFLGRVANPVGTAQ